MRLRSGSTFRTGVLSTDTTDEVHVRWHYRAGATGGAWSDAGTVVPN